MCRGVPAFKSAFRPAGRGLSIWIVRIPSNMVLPVRGESDKIIMKMRLQGRFHGRTAQKRKVEGMKKINRIFLVVLTMVLAGLLAGCGTEKAEKAPDASGISGNMAEKFTDFDGVQSCEITAGWGKGLHVNYTIEVEQGALELKVTGPAGRVIWQGVFQEDERGNLDLPIMLGGDYKISMSGQRAGGGFALAWTVE